MLTKENLHVLRKKLLALQSDLQEKIHAVEKVPEFGTDVDHFEEEGDEAAEFSKNLGEGQAFRLRLDRVREALRKMDEGTYGICERCGKEIEPSLLEVDPESELCKTCKRGADR